MEDREIRELNAQLNQERSRLDAEERRAVQHRLEAEALRKKVQELESELRYAKVSDGGPVITEHAILRYLERVCGVDIEKIKGELMPSDTAEAISRLGTGVYPVRNSHRLRVRKKTIVTVLSREEEHACV